MLKDTRDKVSVWNRETSARQ